MKTTPEPVPVVVVGGGSVLLGADLAGASALIKPHHGGVANAIGAAIAHVSGETDRVLSLQQRSRAQVLEQARQEAIDKAVAAGAVPGSARAAATLISARCWPNR